jgi:hypothetical protein
MLQNCLRQKKSPLTDSIFSWHHQDGAMVLFTKIYGELSLRIQQSLRRCNNRSEFKRMQQRPSVKKLLAYEKEVNERFAKTP